MIKTLLWHCEGFDLLSSEYVVIVYLFMYYYVNVSVLLCRVQRSSRLVSLYVFSGCYYYLFILFLLTCFIALIIKKITSNE